MNASQLFKAAHELAQFIIQKGDDYRATFGICLKALRSGSLPDLRAVSERQRKYAADIRAAALAGLKGWLNDKTAHTAHDVAAREIARLFSIRDAGKLCDSSFFKGFLYNN